MADSKRLKILKDLTAHLEGITDSEGTAYLDGKVWRGRMRPGTESQVPYLNIFEMPPEEENRTDQQTAQMPWIIGIQGYVRAGQEHLTDPAHNLMAAVKERLGELMNFGGGGSPPANYMLNGQVEDMQLDGGMVFSPDETTDCAFFALKLTLSVVEELENLYAS